MCTKCTSSGIGVDLKDAGEPALCRLIIVALWIGDEGAEGRWRGTSDVRSKTIELTDSGEPGDRMTTRSTVDSYGIVNLFHDETVASAKTLIRWLKAELVAIVGKTLLSMGQARKP